MFETMIILTLAIIGTVKVSLEIWNSIKLAKKGAYEMALDSLRSADIIHGIILFSYKVSKKKWRNLFSQYSDSKFAKLYIMAFLFKEFRGIFVIKKPKDLRNYPREALYIDKKFPKEYVRIMNLPKVKKSFENLDTQVKNIFIFHYKDNKNRDKVSGHYPFDDKHQKLFVNLTDYGAFDFGKTNLRADIKSQKITRKNRKITIEFSYDVYMYDYFEKPLGDNNGDFGRVYIMRTSPKNRNGKITL